jgi:hypothetical protein
MRFDPAIKMSVQRMQCTVCGAEANASCNCGQPYVPAKQRAAEAVAANPQKSDRAIAEEIGVSHPTVAKARKEATGNDLPVDKPRVGKDGKTRRLPEKSKEAKGGRNNSDDMPTEEEAEESWQNDLYDQACLLLEQMAGETRQRFFAKSRPVHAGFKAEPEPKPAKDDRPPSKDVNSITRALGDLVSRINTWIETKPEISQDGAAAFMQTLFVHAEELSRIAHDIGAEYLPEPEPAPIDLEALKRDAAERAKARAAERDVMLEVINAGYRSLATKTHPDVGGSADQMAKLNQARDKLRDSI